MGKTLSIDLRARLVAAVSEGMSRRGAAERFGVSAASAVRWVAAVRTTGIVAAKPKGRRHTLASHRRVQRRDLGGRCGLYQLALIRTDAPNRAYR